MERKSTRENWQRFWERHKKVEEIYPTSDSVVKNICAVTDVKGKKILEVGGGTGRDSIKLSRNGAHVTVLDYADNALHKVREAMEHAQVSLRLIQGDGLVLPFAGGSFDIVFHQGLLEHFRDPLPLLRENIRVLKTGGFLVIDVPQKYHIYTLIKHILIIMNKWFAGWETEFSIQELRALYRAHNLIVCREYGDYMAPSLFYRMIRELFKRAGIVLPMYPRNIPVLGNIRKSVKSYVTRQPFAINTFLTIGIIGKKV